MLRSAVRTLVKALVDFDPQAYATADVDLNALISERADAFAVLARAFLARPSLSVSAQATPGPYALDLKALGVTDPTDVWVGGRALYDLGPNELRSGPVSLQQAMQTYPDLLARVPAPPVHWWALSPETVEIWPAPSAAATVHVLGTGLHGALAGDSDATRFPQDLDRPFAYDVAAELLLPRASGETLERALSFRSMADAAAARYRLRAEEATQGRAVRGGGRGSSRARLGG